MAQHFDRMNRMNRILKTALIEFYPVNPVILSELTSQLTPDAALDV
jgi:hypothetical protein